jgi:hypothetical protein
MPGIQSRPVEVFKNLFSFLSQRSSTEERVAQYVIREHERGRALDRPEVVAAVSTEARESTRAALDVPSPG